MPKLLDELKLTDTVSRKHRVHMRKPTISLVNILRVNTTVTRSGSKAQRGQEYIKVDVLRSLRQVRLDLKHGVANAVAFLTMVKTQSEMKSSPETREALSDLLVSSLSSALESGRLLTGGAGFEVSAEWDQCVLQLYTLYKSWSIKPKVLPQVSHFTPYIFLGKKI